MTAVLETARFQLQPICVENLEHRALYITLYTDPLVMRYILPPLSIRAAGRAFERLCEYTAGDGPGHRYWIVVDTVSTHAVGLAGFRRDGDEAELGVMLCKPWWRRGVATESLQLLLGHGFGAMALSLIFAQSLEAHAPVVGALFANLGFTATANGNGMACMSRWELTRAQWESRQQG